MEEEKYKDENQLKHMKDIAVNRKMAVGGADVIRALNKDLQKKYRRKARHLFLRYR